jgi:glycosyltransferase involved in cell wall biosynthesis
VKILYVTHIWEGFKDILYLAHDSISGMPAFLEPLRFFALSGHEIDIICIAETVAPELINVSSGWMEVFNVLTVVDRYRLGRLRAAQQIYFATSCALKNKQYDVVFAHGPIAEPSRWAANKKNIPFVHRLYGTFYYEKALVDGWFITAIKRPFEFLSFYGKKNALIVTDDGTKADRVVKKINGKKCPFNFHYLLNGVRIENTGEYDVKYLLGKYDIVGPYLFSCGRIDRWKGQDILIELASRFKMRGLMLNVYLAGHVSDVAFYEEIVCRSRSLNIEDRIHFLGAIPREHVCGISRGSVATIFNQKFSNLGNAFHEIFSSGGVVVCKNDNEVARFMDNSLNGFFFDDLNELESVIIKLISDAAAKEEIICSAHRKAKCIYLDWSQRCKVEEQILFSAATR